MSEGGQQPDTAMIMARFGHCIIRRGTLLYRGHPSVHFDSCMFFALRYGIAAHFNGQPDVQVWQTSVDIEVLFAVDSVDRVARGVSALPELYKMALPDVVGEVDDLAIKLHSNPRRADFVLALNNDWGIDGWLSSLEGWQELEICLFSNEHMVLLETVADGQVKYPLHSLHGLSIFPSEEFFARSYRRINGGLMDSASIDMARKKYQRHIQDIRDDDRERIGHENHPDTYIDLRTKLNI